MNLEQQVMAEMKDAMKSKNEATLRGLRAIKAEIIKAKTEPGAGGEISNEKELSMLQKMMKQRKDSLEIYQQQNRTDLAQKEEEEIAIIEKFLPKQMSSDELRAELQTVISETGASSPADMGKVMGVATKKLAGRTDAKTISAMVKELLSGK
ncbi:MAG: GatB/YqeY domain-containing protein [Flavisolibacter sp.]